MVSISFEIDILSSIFRLTNPTKVSEILQQLEIELPKTDMDVKTIEIISGKDEGIYGWITTNYLLETLEKTQVIFFNINYF